MTHVKEILDPIALEDLVADGYVNVTEHPDGDIVIYNYTPKAQYEWRSVQWPKEALQARGLIVDPSNGEIIARPFPKFFNWQEWEGKIPNGDYKVTEKMDGSLGIMYRHPSTNQISIATRGSFTSAQAERATEIYRNRYSNAGLEMMLPSSTHLFEIIYPENRIVCDYGDTSDLYYITTVSIINGKSIALSPGRSLWEGPRVKEYKIDNWDELLKVKDTTNREGFVVCFDNELRLKVKFDEYVRLHRIVTNTSTKTVWEYMKDNRSLEDLLERVPDEFNDWLNTTMVALNMAFSKIKTTVQIEFAEITDEVSHIQATSDRRKAFASLATKPAYSPILFKMLDGTSYDHLIWSLIRPPFSRPYKTGANDAE